jgi:polysaccharide biosynthesis protein PslJ
VRPMGRPTLLRPGWIVFTVFSLNPVWWLLGFGDFVWPMAALPLWMWILLQREVRLPQMVRLFILYIVWALVTIVQLDRVTRLLSFGFRYFSYLSALGLAIYVFNERRVTRTKFIRWVSWYWVAAILGGYLSFVMPNATVHPTLASMLLPGSITSNDFVGGLVRPGFAQVQNLFGIALPRPKTLFSFTNEWGGNVGLLTPFFVASFLYSTNYRDRRFGTIMLIIAIPPMIISVNRGLWISVTLIFVIVALRNFRQGRTFALKLLVGAIALVGLLIIATPLREVVGGRLGDSDASTRAGIYSEAWEGAKKSPLLGWGGPRPSANPFSPSIGTHGHVFLVMFSHGFVGLGLYVGWAFNTVFGSMRRRDPVSIMLACVLIVGAVQMLFYNLLPTSIPIILTAIGLLARPPDDSLFLAQRARMQRRAQVGALAGDRRG